MSGGPTELSIRREEGQQSIVMYFSHLSISKVLETSSCHGKGNILQDLFIFNLKFKKLVKDNCLK